MNILTQKGIVMDAQGFIAKEGVVVARDGDTYAIGGTCHRRDDIEDLPTCEGTTCRLGSRMAGWEVSW